MKRVYLLLVCLFLLALAVMLTQGFTAKSLTVTLAPNGDARINMQYDLSFLEESALGFSRMADPAAEGNKAFDSNTKRPVTVNKRNEQLRGYRGTVFCRNKPEKRSNDDDISLDLVCTGTGNPEKLLVCPARVPGLFTRCVTTITFPDGYKAIYYDQISIPSVTQQLSK